MECGVWGVGCGVWGVGCGWATFTKKKKKNFVSVELIKGCTPITIQITFKLTFRGFCFFPFLLCLCF